MTLLEALRNDVIVAKFKKKNGELRVMRCTLKEGLVPKIYGSVPSTETSYVTVWDLEKENWRSLSKECTYEISN